MYHKTLLDSGVRVISEAISSVRSVAVGVWVHTGSRDESPSQAGISHFVEHMVFKGTRRRRMQHIARRMESVGGYLNAFTAKEYTCFEARSLDIHLARAIDAAADLVTEPAFPPKELEKEKGVVLEEMKMYADVPEELVFDRFERVVYEDHALGHPVIGFPHTVSALTRPDLVDFLHQRYTPERIVVAVAGNVDHKAAVRATDRAFRNFSRKNHVQPREDLRSYTPQRVEVSRPDSPGAPGIGATGAEHPGSGAGHDEPAKHHSGCGHVQPSASEYP